MSERRGSISADNIPRDNIPRELADNSRSLSTNDTEIVAVKRSYSADSTDDILNIPARNYSVTLGETLYLKDQKASCEVVKRAFSSVKTKTMNELLPCDSCEFSDPADYIEVTFCWGCCKRFKSWEQIPEFWLISLPKEENTLETLNKSTKNLSYNYKFHAPVLKVGVLNTMMENIDHLKTLDNFVREVLENIVKTLSSEVGKQKDLLQENLKIYGYSPAAYLTRFSWNRSKYPTWHQTAVIADEIYSHVDNINECLKQKLSQLDKINADVKPYEHRETESLKIRYLGDIVKKEHFVQDSKFLTTLLVVVPNKKKKFWTAKYTDLSEMVVPNSSMEIYDDGTDTLYSVTLSLKYVDLFKKNARKHNFIVRDYKYSEEDQATEKEYYENRSLAKLELKIEILKYAKIMFGEVFDAWIHVKTLRSFVESVVRFGIPVNYQTILIIPLKSKPRLMKILQKLYKDVDSVLAVGNVENIPGGLAAFYDVNDYYPFVFFSIYLGFIYK